MAGYSPLFLKDLAIPLFQQRPSVISFCQTTLFTYSAAAAAGLPKFCRRLNYRVGMASSSRGHTELLGGVGEI